MFKKRNRITEKKGVYDIIFWGTIENVQREEKRRRKGTDEEEKEEKIQRK